MNKGARIPRSIQWPSGHPDRSNLPDRYVNQASGPQKQGPVFHHPDTPLRVATPVALFSGAFCTAFLPVWICATAKCSQMPNNVLEVEFDAVDGAVKEWVDESCLLIKPNTDYVVGNVYQFKVRGAKYSGRLITIQGDPTPPPSPGPTSSTTLIEAATEPPAKRAKIQSKKSSKTTASLGCLLPANPLLSALVVSPLQEERPPTTDRELLTLDSPLQVPPNVSEATLRLLHGGTAPVVSTSN